MRLIWVTVGQIVVHEIPALASVERWSSPGAVFLIDTLSLAQILKGDVNNDGSVDNLDIAPFIALLAGTVENCDRCARTCISHTSSSAVDGRGQSLPWSQ